MSFTLDLKSFIQVLQTLLTIVQSQRENLKANLPVSQKYNLLLTLATSNESIPYSQLISVFDGKEKIALLSSELRDLLNYSL